MVGPKPGGAATCRRIMLQPLRRRPAVTGVWGSLAARPENIYNKDYGHYPGPWRDKPRRAINALARTLIFHTRHSQRKRATPNWSQASTSMKRYRVLISVSNGSHLGRAFVGGIAKFACVQRDWDVRFISGREDDCPPDELVREKFDGAIVAAYFIERGFRNFAFAGGLQSGVWSDAREASFVAALKKSGYPCAVYKHGGRNAPRVFRHALREDARTCEWMMSLPKPLAVFAAYDRRGQQILRCCRKLGLQVPRDVAVVGMDNDETICESCSPPLSSLSQNLDQVGMLAAGNLDKLMRGWTPPGGGALVMCTSAGQIVTRESSDIRFDCDSALVARGMALVNDEQFPATSVSALASRLCVSERLLRLRFRQNLGTTPHAAIASARLARARRMLAETGMPIAQISEACGFTDVSHMDKVFRKHLGARPFSFRR